MQSSMTSVVEQWLETNVKNRDGHVDAQALVLLAKDFDTLNQEEMTPHQYNQSRRAYLKDIEAKQKRILEQEDGGETSGLRSWGQTSSLWLGMIPYDLLENNKRLQTTVVNYLEKEHGISKEIWDDNRK